MSMFLLTPLLSKEESPINQALFKVAENKEEWLCRASLYTNALFFLSGLPEGKMYDATNTEGIIRFLYESSKSFFDNFNGENQQEFLNASLVPFPFQWFCYYFEERDTYNELIKGVDNNKNAIQNAFENAIHQGNQSQDGTNSSLNTLVTLLQRDAGANDSEKGIATLFIEDIRNACASKNSNYLHVTQRFFNNGINDIFARIRAFRMSRFYIANNGNVPRDFSVFLTSYLRKTSKKNRIILTNISRPLKIFLTIKSF